MLHWITWLFSFILHWEFKEVRMYIYTTTENYNLTNNFSEPVLPENPIRYNRVDNFGFAFAPLFFVIIILVIFILDNLFKAFVKCIMNYNKSSKQKKDEKNNNQRSKFVIDMECNECKDCAGKLLCKHKITRV